MEPEGGATLAVRSAVVAVVTAKSQPIKEPANQRASQSTSQPINEPEQKSAATELWENQLMFAEHKIPKYGDISGGRIYLPADAKLNI